MRKAWRVPGLTAAVLLVVVMLSPGIAYEAIPLGMEGRPVKPVEMASADQQALVWQSARGSGELRVEAMNPYRFVWTLLSVDRTVSAGETLAYRVSSEHLLAQPRRNMLWWHLSNAALTIWLTRHWTSEELASAAWPVFDREQKYRAHRAADAAAEAQSPARSRAASAM